LCIDPRDIEHRITERTKAIVVVHYGAHPADMDPILAIARRQGVAVIEGPSHAHGALFRGKLVGTMGMAEIDRAMNYFGDLLEDAPGIRVHRPPRDSRLMQAFTSGRSVSAAY
jgi:hypothetical protein